MTDELRGHTRHTERTSVIISAFLNNEFDIAMIVEAVGLVHQARLAEVCFKLLLIW